MIRVSVVGASGRMGQELFHVISLSPGLKPSVGFVSKKKQSTSFEYTAHEFNKESAAKTDVVIDFSSLEALPDVVSFCSKHRLPLVCGTTGLTSTHLQHLEKAGKKIPVLWAPNMSVGVAVLRRALSALSAVSEFDFQIEEFHHSKKKDNPSGTALQIQETLEKAIKRKCPQPIGVRGGGIIGTHKVYAMSDEEVLLFEHQAIHRRVFAKGAVRAALWLRKQKAGFYGIDDLLLK
ncbi:MAG: 4-hydroxy-tetrahydrodipicolinate reductase [Proteobacteria bacterium]|jgi:4-hydroxy-tetrahydrodipicolinate reductase|nr:4-hydroxy-tetrahydrodipicolinate reductase [Pseudomonadota bacterium]